jgi:16S rRNA (cytidine1402-2'-O)-methyltransferase
MPSNSNTDSDTSRTPMGAGLYIVGTPIGNRKDITLRALEVLRNVDFIACEDTRKTGQLLKWHQIENKLMSFHEHNEERRTPQLIDQLKQGSCVALVSDAGMPLVSDPGYRLVQAAIAADLTVVPIPGPCAPISALSVSGLPSDAFVFFGFPPRKPGKLQKFTEMLAAESKTSILFESPHRICDFLVRFQRIDGDRSCMVAREMTKLYEENIRGTISQVLENLQERSEVKGEITLVIAGATQRQAADETQIRDEIRRELGKGNAGVSEISRDISTRHGISKKIIYQTALDILENETTKRRKIPGKSDKPGQGHKFNTSKKETI